jgi:pimeloyl-[acyl-carrier protein] methyl ester esterase
MPSPTITLVLMPGLDGTGKLFSNLLPFLSDQWPTTTVCYPTDVPLSYAELLPFVRAVPPISAPFILIAESFSTPLAIQFAAKHPPNLKGVILCAGFATSPLKGWRKRAVSLAAAGLMRLPLPNAVMRCLLVGQEATPELCSSVRAAISTVSSETLTTRLRQVLTCDVRAELVSITVPLLYLQATNDRLVKASNSEEIRRKKPDTKFVSIAGPHMLLQRQPQKAAAFITSFIQELS